MFSTCILYFSDTVHNIQPRKVVLLFIVFHCSVRIYVKIGYKCVNAVGCLMKYKGVLCNKLYAIYMHD